MWVNYRIQTQPSFFRQNCPNELFQRKDSPPRLNGLVWRNSDEILFSSRAQIDSALRPIVKERDVGFIIVQLEFAHFRTQTIEKLLTRGDIFSAFPISRSLLEVLVRVWRFLAEPKENLSALVDEYHSLESNYHSKKLNEYGDTNDLGQFVKLQRFIASADVKNKPKEKIKRDSKKWNFRSALEYTLDNLQLINSPTICKETLLNNYSAWSNISHGSILALQASNAFLSANSQIAPLEAEYEIEHHFHDVAFLWMQTSRLITLRYDSVNNYENRQRRQFEESKREIISRNSQI